jgi:class 3 adenylate cyclase
MASSTFENILKEREIKNEKKVALVRFALSLSVIIEVLGYLEIIKVEKVPALTAIIIAIILFIYASIVLVLLLKNKHSKYLKFYVIFFDYLYVTLSFFFDPELTNNSSTIVWFALVGAIVFYLINLLRYSKIGTLYAGILSLVVFISINLHFGNLIVDIIPMVFALIIILFIGYSITAANIKMMVEANTKKMMERYLPPQLIEELYKKYTSIEPGGEKKVVTILFSDIRSFTSISESMRAEEVVSFLNDYLSTMTDIIFTQEGTIDKFIGDSIMTIFGAPVSGKDDALRAIKAAILMEKELVNFNSRHDEFKDSLRIGVGIHTGEVVAGNIGSDKRLDYTVIGDNVNLSSRIEGLTSFYNCSILISDSTYNQLNHSDIEDLFCLREVDDVKVKGKSTPVKIYEVLGFENSMEKDKLETKIELFEKGLVLYRSKKFKEAISLFEKISDDELSSLYIKRCSDLILNPPETDWDGTFVMLTK